jgi:hypothetical protein
MESVLAEVYPKKEGFSTEETVILYYSLFQTECSTFAMIPYDTQV